MKFWEVRWQRFENFGHFKVNEAFADSNWYTPLSSNLNYLLQLQIDNEESWEFLPVFHADGATFSSVDQFLKVCELCLSISQYFPAKHHSNFNQEFLKLCKISNMKSQNIFFLHDHQQQFYSAFMAIYNCTFFPLCTFRSSLSCLLNVNESKLHKFFIPKKNS